MDDFETPQNELERAIATVAEAGDDADTSARRAVLVALVGHDVTVVLPAPNEDGSPPENAVPLFVSDGANAEQPMLAVFTRHERALGFQAQSGDETAHVADLPGPQVLLGTPEGAGIMLNPNQPLAFRVPPELATVLRGEVNEAMERARSSAQTGLQ